MSHTVDDFLGGRIRVRQPVDGYRAGADPVFLAAAVPAVAGEHVLDLGCGAGVAMLCLAARVPGVGLVGVERDAASADLARGNLRDNGTRGEVVTADLTDLPHEIGGRGYHHVMTNPPFFDRGRGSRAETAAREAGRGEETPLSDWLEVAMRRLLPGGTLTIIQRAERLPDCLCALDGRVGGTVVLPLAPRVGRAAKLVVIQTKKGSKGAFRISPPFVLHDGERHEDDSESYSPGAGAILREGKAFDEILRPG